jgi:serine/threonine-protein kinase
MIQERFQREAAILEVLGRASDQIPTLYAYFTEDREFYLVQDWIEGKNLSQKVREEGAFSESQVRGLLIDLLPVLDYIHSQGIIHRDIKPANIMLRGRDSRPTLIDFGAVKEVVAKGGDPDGVTSNSIVMGSPGFMPLEQAAGKPVFASDLYSLGLTAVYLLTGKRPQEMTDPSTGGVLWREYVANVSPELTAILEKAIKPFPHERYRTAREMLEALQSTDPASDITVLDKRAPDHAAQRYESVPSTAAALVTPGEPRPRHGRDRVGHRFAYALGLLSAVLLTGVGLWFFYDGRNETRTLPAQVNNDAEPPAVSQPDTQTVNFEITRTADAFTSVRAAPTTKSAERGRLYPGTKITCQSTVKGERLFETDEWRYCPSVGGYIHSKLLRPAQ